MTGVETALIQVGRLVVGPAVTRWLGARRQRAERELPLAELINRRVTDELSRRKVEREIEAMVDAVAERLQPLVATRFAALPANERDAALAAVADTFGRADLTDEGLFGADADPATLAAQLRRRCADVPVRAGLSEPAERLYQVALDECCAYLAALVVQLPSFAARADAELLGRTARLADELRALAARVPATSVDAPAGTPHDDAFGQRYLAYLAKSLNELELFGVDIHHYRPRTTLSIAYISLTVSTDGEPLRPERAAWAPGGLRRAAAERPGVRVEQALGRGSRFLLRGDAGSGKSTVLKWLAVTAAHGGFESDLAPWNGCVPLLVKLRSHTGRRLPGPERFLDGVADPIAGLMPPGWVHRRLASGAAILLVDGVDELPAADRPLVKPWLSGLLREYPGIRMVVTSRPAAAAERWLTDEGFTSAMLERMSPADIRALVRHWHHAVRDAGSLPCPEPELPRYESALLARLDGSAHLQSLAASPLLCAMLCALNLDRNTHLPHDRMTLYQAAVDLLLERRDTQRNLVEAVHGLSARDKLQLLQGLAWRLSVNNATELSRAAAEQRVGERLAAMPQVDGAPAAVLDHLVHRSGVLREPVPGRIDFVHRTFQEYLTAREAAEQGDVGLLLEHAHLDSWRETVVMAAGHGNAVVRRELLAGLLDRAGSEPRHGRALRLLAAACLGTVPALDPPELLERVEREFRSLLPPRTVAEARSLAAVGDPLVRRLPRDSREMPQGRAAAAIRAAALVNGPGALDLLAAYAADPRPEVQRELARVWEYFDPHEYAERVLAQAPLPDGEVTVTNPGLLPAVHRLGTLRSLSVRFATTVDLRCLDGLPHLAEVAFDEGVSGGLAPLAAHPGLRRLDGYFAERTADPSPIAALTGLEFLNLWLLPGLTSIGFVRDLGRVTRLELGYVDQVRDLSLIAAHQQLETLQVHRWTSPDLSPIAALPRLELLGFYDSPEPPGALAALAAAAPGVRSLWLNGCRWIRDLRPLAGLAELGELAITGVPDADLSALAGCPKLRTLFLGYGDELDLRPVATLRSLQQLKIGRVTGPIDLSPLAGRTLELHLVRNQPVRGADELGPGVAVRRLPD
ncbi:NACHT domain-containing protein [Dactylosporangium sp. NPDC049140]|uniref:NACHT domain-containing protein n=1 Tax=Dactylosporangium sp. NPDC049140 TaxID=3155647 RepID=UPI0033DE3647